MSFFRILPVRSVALLTFIAIVLPAALAAGQDAVEILQIPDAWKRAPGNSAAGKDGHAWYRCGVKIPAEWQGKDIEVYLEAVDDAREAYLNGKLLGGFGAFPPTYRSGLGGEQRFKIAAGDFRAGAVNVFAIRVYQEAARDGFNVAAPVIFGPGGSAGQAMRLEGKWQFRFGDNLKWGTSFGDAAPPDEIVYAKLESADAVAQSLKKLKDQDDGPLTIAETLKRITAPADLKVEVVLSEPAIGQPLSIKWDERGRMWLVEYLQYPNPAGLKMVSRDKFLRSVYDKVPPAPPNHFKGQDRISIHEDTDGDGQFDKHTNFVDDLSLVSSFAIGRGGVFVLNPPYLLFYPDKNLDDKPDGDPEVLLEGFGIEDSHSIANSLRWGPDGWLYACQGSTVTGSIKRPGTKDKPVHSMGQLIWRYHPEQRRYEIFAEGGGNSFGLEIDSKGRIYSGHNGGDTRGFHYVQGGYFQKGFGKHGELSNPYAYGYFPQMPHNAVPRFTHNFVIYEDALLPKPYQGRLFGVAPLQGHVTMSDVAPHGSSFKTNDVGHVMQSTDTWVRPVDIQVGPDGAMYVADLYEQRIDHASHYQGRVHKQSGRIYRIAPDSAAPKKFRFNEATSEQIVEQALTIGNRWHRQTALRVLSDRQDKSLAASLRERVSVATGQTALELLWALHLCGGLDDEAAIQLLDHNDPYVRAWIVRLVCDDFDAAPEVVRKLNQIAANEPNVEVRSQLACSARRLKSLDCLGIAISLLHHSADTDDPYVPLLLWWAIESKCAAHRDDVVDVFRDQTLWSLTLVQDHILERLMRRFAQAGTRADLLACAELLKIAPNAADRKRLLAGFEKAYEGRMLAGLPDELIAAIAQSGGGSLALRMRQSDENALKEGLAIVQNERADAKHRVQLIGIMGQLAHESFWPVLLKVAQTAGDNAVRSAALNALMSFEQMEIASGVLKLFNALDDEPRQVAAALLASRGRWSLALAQAVSQGEIKQETVSLDAVRKMLLHQDPALQTAMKEIWGEVEGASTEQMLADIQRYTDVLGGASGNPYKGKELFKQNCAKCHVLFTDGNFIGPELTSYKRDDLARVMVNVVNPSIEIREGFENYVLYTADGRVLNGFLSEQDNQVVVLRSAEGQITVIPRDEIEEMKAIRRSLMPEGLLKPYDDQQIRDLFAYLRATQPLP